MTFDPKDLRLTAYALGELDEAERSEIEALLAKSPEARELVEEIARTAELLGRALKAESSAGLRPEQLTSIQKAARAATGTRWKLWTGAIAAGLLLATTLSIWRLGVPSYSEPLQSGALGSPAAAPQVDRLEGSGPGPAPAQPTLAAAQPQTAVLNRRSGAPPSHPSGAPVPLPSPQNTARSIRTTQEGNLTGVSGAIPDTRSNERSQPRPEPPPTASRGKNEVSPPIQGRHSFELIPVVGSGGLPGHDEADPRGGLPQREREFDTETYDRILDNPFREVALHPLSTFSIDVDTASYANVRRFLTGGSLPPADSVRIEELVNYFRYGDAPPRGEQPFAVHLEAASAPWKPQHLLVRIGLRGRDVDLSRRPPSNLVFLLDVSGSMEPANKLPLLKRAFKLLVDELAEQDRVAMVVYAGASGLVLPSTSGDQKQRILDALDDLRAGGSTNGASGIQLAYQTAQQNFIPGGINRVILATDGDFNVGVTSQGELTRLIEQKAKTGVFLSVLGFGMGNYKDSTLEKLADQGNGNYAYIDSFREARKVLVEELAGTLITIAKDVKIQVEFNPARVKAYRLIGYENRLLQSEDFNDDTKDAGEIGAGHSITALYEVVPVGVEIDLPGVDPLKYQAPRGGSLTSGELLTVKLRYKEPNQETSRLLEFPLAGAAEQWRVRSDDFRFAAAVAAFGMLLRDSPHKGLANWAEVREWARGSVGEDEGGHRREFLQLVQLAERLQAAPQPQPR